MRQKLLVGAFSIKRLCYDAKTPTLLATNYHLQPGTAVYVALNCPRIQASFIFFAIGPAVANDRKRITWKLVMKKRTPTILVALFIAVLHLPGGELGHINVSGNHFQVIVNTIQ